MRTVTFGVANSLDNFIARKDGAVDWLQSSDEVRTRMAEYWKTIDTILMGRKTYEFAAAAGMTSYGGLNTFVFSSTVKDSPDPRVQIIREEAGEFVRKLKEQPGKGICLLGGRLLANSLFKAGVIDEVGFNIHPVLLGSGVPLFLELDRQIDLELLDCKTLKSGCVLVSYRVKK